MGKTAIPVKLTVKQQRFCDEYLKDFNATRAAIAAKYSKDTAAVIGSENLRKPNIKAYINQRMQEAQLSAEETTKLISDIAKGSLNNYFKSKQVEHTPRIKVGLKELIKQLNEEIILEDEYASKAGLSPDELNIHNADRALRKRKILRYQIELKRNPAAYRIVDGQAEMIETVELDLVELVKDKERGRIKGISYTQYGPKVELCNPTEALINAARMHGLFAKDNEQQKPDYVPPFNNDQVNNILSALKNKK